jgi:hypothetical protein
MSDTGNRNAEMGKSKQPTGQIQNTRGGFRTTPAKITALTVQIVSFTICLDGMDGPDGQNPTLNNQPMSAEQVRPKGE